MFKQDTERQGDHRKLQFLNNGSNSDLKSTILKVVLFIDRDITSPRLVVIFIEKKDYVCNYFKNEIPNETNS